jgi:hypothetical protein
MNDDELDGLDLAVVTITEEPDTGRIAFNHEGMSMERTLWLLESAKTLLLNGYWYDDEDEDDED